MGPVGAAITSAGIGAAGRIVGGVLSSSMSAKQAKINRQFQERMSSTAYQRAAADLEAAGLNRILAIGSPASTPGGAMGNVADFGNVGSDWAGGLQAGANVASSAAQINKMDAEIKKIEAETGLTNSKAGQQAAQTELWKTLAPIMVTAGQDFGKLVAFLRDPQTYEDLERNIKYATEQSVDEIYKAVMKMYNPGAQAASWLAEALGKKIAIGEQKND